MLITSPAWWKTLSLTPRFIAVEASKPAVGNGFNRFPSRDKETVKTVSDSQAVWITAMNRGVNEKLDSYCRRGRHTVLIVESSNKELQ
jgi:hypothetical protein